MESTVIERIKRIIEYKQVSSRAFAKAVGFNYTTLNNYLTGRRGSVDNDLLSKIILSYDDISSHWLITGKGEMLKATSDNGKSNMTTSFRGTFTEPLVADVRNTMGDTVIGNNAQNRSNNSQMSSDVELLQAKIELDFLRKEIERLNSSLNQALVDKDKAIADKDRAMAMLEKILNK